MVFPARALLLMVIALCAILGRSAEGQTTERDIHYGPEPQQTLDLTVPAATRYSTLIFVHGGSLTTGDKADEDYGAVCRPFVAHGIGCANINYRLAPGHKWPAQAEDVALAVAWVAANIESRGGDRRKVVLAGHSSGATLSALVGTDDRYLAQQHLALTDLRGVIAMGSIMWDDDLQQAIERNGRARIEERFRQDPDNAMYGSFDQYLDRWPFAHLKAGLPPILLLIAEAEQEQPPILRTNRVFVERSRSLGNRAEYLVLKDRDHYSAIHRVGEAGDPAFTAIREFVVRVTQ
jgi:acetyl esterase/lipase